MLRSDAVLLNKVLYLLAVVMLLFAIGTAFLATRPPCASVPKSYGMSRSLASLQPLDT
jgi:hypothetical protein